MVEHVHFQNKRVNNEALCSARHGSLDGNQTGLCTVYYWATKVCVQITKDAITGKWKLDSNNFNQDSYGCAFEPPSRIK
jgi:uncharacterized protein with FMN-binding domain